MIVVIECMFTKLKQPLQIIISMVILNNILNPILFRKKLFNVVFGKCKEKT